MSSTSSQIGVYYHPEAFLGFWSRIAIAMIDTAVVGAASAVLAAALSIALPPPLGPTASGFGVLIIASAYFIVLKRTAIRTVGHQLFGVRVVDLHGERPGVLQMVNRFLFLALVPVNGLVDLLWVSTDDSKQAIHDLWSQTYLVLVSAEPAGRGRIGSRRYGIMGFNFVFLEVLKDGSAPA